MDPLIITSGRLSDLEWRPLSYVGEEAISALFWFSAIVSASKVDVDDALAQRPGAEGPPPPVEEALAQQSVRFRLGDEGLWRHALIAEAVVEGLSSSESDPAVVVRLRLVPHLWLLNHRTCTRIFQNKYLHEIVTEVLERYRIRHRWELHGTYPRRLYCTQYEETDYQFLARILAEEGVFFFFEHPQDGWQPRTDSPDEPDDVDGELERVSNALRGASRGVAGMGTAADNDTLLVAGKLGEAAADRVELRERDEEHDRPRRPGAGHRERNGRGEVFVFADQNVSYLEPPVELRLWDIDGTVPDVSGVVAVASAASAAPIRAEVRDYDFRRPLLDLTTSSGEDGARHDGEGLPLEAYWHHGDFDKPFLPAPMGQARIHLEQHRTRTRVSSAQSISPRLLPGGRLDLRNMTAVPVPELSRLAVVRIRHEAYDPGAAAPSAPAPGGVEALAAGCAEAFQEALERGERLSHVAVRDMLVRALANPQTPPPYRNRFECVPADVPCRPPRPRRAMRTTTETATVVGPSKRTGGDGDEIYLDKYGRVKVQFHWDRDGKWNEKSSCWVRVAQAWAGAGYGFQFLPRVGMEVLVAYVGGDPDRPIVVGALYNATHPTPEPLPDRKTRSGIRTQSSPGGGGFNEISFEDAKGSERIYVHAEKDLEQVVKDAHVLDVAGKQTVLVGDARHVAVSGDESSLVQGNRSTTLGAADTTVVRGSRNAQIGVNETAVVGGHDSRDVGGLAFRRVGADALAVVEGDCNLSVHGDAITQIGGGKTTEKSNSITFVQGSSFLTATDKIVVKAGDLVRDGDRLDAARSSIRLECGKSSIVLTHNSIIISAPTVTVAGSHVVQLVRASPMRPLPPPPPKIFKLDRDEARLFSEVIHLETGSAKLDLDHANAALIGNTKVDLASPSIELIGQSKINLVSPSINQVPVLAPETPRAPGRRADQAQTVAVQLTFTFQRPGEGGTKIRNTACRMVVGDSVMERLTDGDGAVTFQVPSAEKTASISLFANETADYSSYFPAEDGPLHWHLHLGDAMPDASSSRGALMRLTNLGYDPSTKAEPTGDRGSGGGQSGGGPGGSEGSGGEPRDGSGSDAGAAQELDDVSREAVRQFLADSEMESADELDEATRQQISDTYGS